MENQRPKCKIFAKTNYRLTSKVFNYNKRVANNGGPVHDVAKLQDTILTLCRSKNSEIQAEGVATPQACNPLSTLQVSTAFLFEPYNSYFLGCVVGQLFKTRSTLKLRNDFIL